MYRYQKWLSAGLLALTPGIATAGSLDSPQLKLGQGPATSAARPAKKTKAAANQELADKVAKALRSTKLNGYDIDIDVRDGVVILEGFVTAGEQRSAATKAVRAVPGVMAVSNRLRVGEPASQQRSDQSAAKPPRSPTTPGFVRLADYQVDNNDPPSIQLVAASEAMPAGTVARGAMGSAAHAGAPVYGSPTGEAGQALYNQPNLPNNTGPAYAQYPNYAAVSYPSQYSAAAWPYMGPFHPYPQCPLGWRKVTLQWDAGLWTLDFGTSRKHGWTSPY